MILGAAIYLFYIKHPAWALILILLCVIILTTKYVTEINLDKKLCKDYLLFLGIETQEEVKTFRSVDRIVITKGDHSQRILTRSRDTQLDWVDYTGTVIFDTQETITLLTRNDKEDLIKGLKEFAEFLKVNVEDRTTHQHYWIDLAMF